VALALNELHGADHADFNGFGPPGRKADGHYEKHRDDNDRKKCKFFHETLLSVCVRSFMPDKPQTWHSKSKIHVIPSFEPVDYCILKIFKY
jgi:hypothetical protein